MKKRNEKKSNAKNVAKYISATALSIPLIVTGPVIMEKVVAQSALEDWVHQRMDGTYIEVGEQITLDLKDFFGEVANPQFTVINHNDPVATVKINGGEITLSGKRAGSTTVDLLVKSGDALEDSFIERFRFEVNPVAGLMMEGKGLSVDDLVRYLQNKPEKSYQQEGLSHLMGYLSPLNRSLNRPPETASEQAIDVIVHKGEQVIYDLRDFYFDPDGDVLNYTLEYEGKDLEVAIYGNQITFTGVSSVEHTIVTVTAHDSFGSNGARKRFLVTVTADKVNTPPQVEGAIPDQISTEGEIFNYTVPEDTFSDADADDTLTFSATLENGDPLPTWLSFESETRTFSGIPNEVEVLVIRVTATDRSEASASTTFQLTIEEMIRVPMALYENIELTFYPPAEMSVDLTQLFTNMDDDDEWKVFVGDDGELVDRGHWADEEANMIADLKSTGMLHVLTSGDISGVSSSLEFQLQAGQIAEQLWSESVLFTINMEQPNTPPIWTVEAGTQVSLSELFHDSFGHYTLDGLEGSFTYEITSALHWADPDLADPDLIHVHSDLEESEFYISVLAKAGDMIKMNKFITLQIVKDGGLDDD